MRWILPLLWMTGCTEPTWYPGLPTGVSADPVDSGAGDDDDSGATDSGATDSGATDSGGTDGGTDSGGDPLPCSTDGGDPATLTIDIQADLGVILWWRASDCQEYSYGAVPPYVPREQGTYVGHVWVLRDAVGNTVDHLTVTETEQRWEVTE